MYRTQNKIKVINREVAKNNDVPLDDVERITHAIWDTTRKVIDGSMYNAIYLRFLGTFYSKKSVRDQVIKCMEKKYDTGQL